MVNECVDCPKPEYLKVICVKKELGTGHAKLRYKDVDCDCEERMRLMKKLIKGNKI